jgi:DNA-binding LacI/PurR family transcriptional regulator
LHDDNAPVNRATQAQLPGTGAVCVRNPSAGGNRFQRNNCVKLTINDIAELTNVSKSTISRVINNSGPVSDKTRKAVAEAIERLDFKPNEIARSLSLRRTMTVGIVLQDIRNPYYANACWHADRLLGQFGYSAVICNVDNDPDREQACLNSMGHRSVDGVICIGPQEATVNIVRAVEEMEIPVVLVDTDPQIAALDTVTLDNVYGGQLVVDYLLSLGHRRIAFVTSDFTGAERDRRLGYTQGLAARGIEVDPSLVISQGEGQWHRGDCPALMDLIRQGNAPTAIFASNDFKAIRIVRLLHRLGVSIPDDISIVGFDDTDAAAMVTPALTTIHQPIDKMMDIGVRILLKRIEEQDGEPEHAVLRPWLVERESTRKVR